MAQAAMSYMRAILTNWSHFGVLSAILLVGEALLGAAIILRVPYTEIDWLAYMQEVEGWVVDGELDYTLLRGDTGPLVYPAGFMYIYAALRWITGGGRGRAAIAAAQWIFLGLYLAVLALVLRIYASARLGPPWVVILLALSKRVHSLFVLRLFNDCWAMLFAYAAIVAFTRHKWFFGCLLFSLGVGVKMNVLLFLPALGILLLRNVGVLRTVAAVALCVAVQVALGAPFLAAHPASYLSRAFELSRVFFHTWTVNWKFLPEAAFTSKALALGLLGGHLSVLLALAHWVWLADTGGLLAFLVRLGLAPRALLCGGGARRKEKGSAAGTATSPDAVIPWASAGWRDPPHVIAYALLSCNFVGIVFARTIHYQFYTWYFHALPFLLWSTDLPVAVRVAVLLGVEYAFNVGDAAGAGTPTSSAVLQVAHWILLIAIAAAGVSGRAPRSWKDTPATQPKVLESSGVPDTSQQQSQASASSKRSGGNSNLRRR